PFGGEKGRRQFAVRAARTGLLPSCDLFFARKRAGVAHFRVDNRQMPQRTAEDAPARVKIERNTRGLSRGARVRLRECCGFRAPPRIINGEEDRGLVGEVAIEGLGRVTRASGDAVGVGAVETARV